MMIMTIMFIGHADDDDDDDNDVDKNYVKFKDDHNFSVGLNTSATMFS